jgi:nucleotide-binding universal stress UspA family protein
MIQRSILVAEDLENDTDVGQRRGTAVRSVAQDVSKLLHEDLQLFYVEDLKTYPQKKIHHEQDLPSWHQEHELALQKLAKELSVKTRPVIRSGTAAEQILKAIHQWPRPEMVIMGTQGHSGFEKFLEGSVAEEVILKAERPVMVQCPLSQEKLLGFKNKKPPRILLPTDFTRASRPAEYYALSLAARLNAEVVLFHSVYDHLKRVHEASIISGFANFDMDRIYQKMTRDATQDLEKKRARFRKVTGRGEFMIAESGQTIAEAVIQEAHQSYCMVVMGTHSKRNVLVRAFIGSTARDTILKSPIPIVVVHDH